MYGFVHIVYNEYQNFILLSEYANSTLHFFFFGPFNIIDILLSLLSQLHNHN